MHGDGKKHALKKYVGAVRDRILDVLDEAECGPEDDSYADASFHRQMAVRADKNVDRNHRGDLFNERCENETADEVRCRHGYLVSETVEQQYDQRNEHAVKKRLRVDGDMSFFADPSAVEVEEYCGRERGEDDFHDSIEIHDVCRKYSGIR